MTNQGQIPKLPIDNFDWVHDIFATCPGQWILKKDKHDKLSFTAPNGQRIVNYFVVDEDQEFDLSKLMSSLRTKSLIVEGGKRR